LEHTKRKKVVMVFMYIAPHWLRQKRIWRLTITDIADKKLKSYFMCCTLLSLIVSR